MKLTLFVALALIALSTQQQKRNCRQRSFRCADKKTSTSCVMAHAIPGQPKCAALFNDSSDPCFVYTAKLAAGDAQKCVWCKPDTHYLDTRGGANACKKKGQFRIKNCGNLYRTDSDGLQCSRCINSVPSIDLKKCEPFSGAHAYQCAVGWRNKGSKNKYCYICNNGFSAGSKQSCVPSPAGFAGCNRIISVAGKNFCQMCNVFFGYFHDGKGGCVKL